MAEEGPGVGVLGVESNLMLDAAQIIVVSNVSVADMEFGAQAQCATQPVQVML